MSDLFDRCSQFTEQQRSVPAEDLELARRVMFSTMPVNNAGPWFEYQGQRCLQFATNDYLGLSRHPQVIAAAVERAATDGIGAPMGARPLSGSCELHLELERRIADYKRTEAGLIFTMGSGAMMGAIASLARPGDLVILDQFAHASLVSGAKLSGASIRYFRHNNMASLEKVLARADPGAAKLLVVDGVYSMNADVAPLGEICDLKDSFGARLLVDDAHGNGVCGPTGRGVGEDQSVDARIDLHAGTFSKAFGTSGGFLAGSEEVLFYIRNLAPTLLFTKAPSAVVTAATLAALDVAEREPERRTRLWANTAYLQGRLREAGFDLGTTCTPITPIAMGSSAIHVAHALRQEHQIYVSPAVYPAVPKGRAILRVVPTALHTESDLDRLVEGLLACAVPGGLEGKDRRDPLSA